MLNWGDGEVRKRRRRRDMTARQRARHGVCLDNKPTPFYPLPGARLASLAAAATISRCISNYTGWERLSALFAEAGSDNSHQLMWDTDETQEQQIHSIQMWNLGCHSGLNVICLSTSCALFLIAFKDLNEMLPPSSLQTLLCFLYEEERGLLFTEMLTQEDAKSCFHFDDTVWVTGLTHRYKSVETMPPFGH